MLCVVALLQRKRITHSKCAAPLACKLTLQWYIILAVLSIRFMANLTYMSMRMELCIVIFY